MREQKTAGCTDCHHAQHDPEIRSFQPLQEFSGLYHSIRPLTDSALQIRDDVYVKAGGILIQTFDQGFSGLSEQNPVRSSAHNDFRHIADFCVFGDLP